MNKKLLSFFNSPKLVKTKERLRTLSDSLPKIKLKRITKTKREKVVRSRKQKLVAALPWALLIVVVFQGIFAVMIYGLKKEDKVTRAVASVIPFPVALANHNVVTYDDYLKEKDYIHHFYGATKQENVNFNEIDRQILDQLVENKIVGFQAWRYGIEVTDSDIDGTLATVVEENGGQEQVEKVLKDLYGLDMKSFRRLINNQLLREKINEDVIAHVTARHILVRVNQDASEADVAAAKAKIDDYLKQIKEGADFGEIAKKHSEDIGSNEQGGQLSPFARGEMVEAFSNTAFTTPVGEISDPVRTEFGWHIIKVEARKGVVEDKFIDWLSQLKKDSVILKLI
ncbi:MAG: Foldase protein PrsA 1 precursor [bacterium ADurb.Bin400]|nr:MAG: Foldase protein PrsA 1 precursor [bacterium ADurb.Bin400]